MMVTTNCSVHGLDSPASVRKDGRKPTCKACSYERVKKRRQEVKKILVAEHGGACIICGYDRCLRCLEFHHKDPSQKEFTLSAFRAKISLDRLREEARKCVLLCSNCHGEVEEGLLTL